MTERLNKSELDDLIGLLSADGYRVIGPTIRDSAIVYEDIASINELPVGWTDEQSPGQYRVRRRDDGVVFGHSAAAQSWKRWLFPPREQLVQIRKRPSGNGNRSESDLPEWSSVADDGAPMAFLGVRACDLAAIEVQDRVFTSGPFVDPRYRARRDRALIVAVNCTEAGELCFCSSMGTGPRANGDFDLRLTEVGNEFLLETGSERGRALADRLPSRPADPELVDRAETAVARCADSMGRHLDTTDLPARLMGNLDHPRWDEVAERCLACGSCTSSCPTCFCFDIADTSGLDTDVAGRERAWDSCFSASHSTIHGAQFRATTRGRYQQWLTHKLATWTAQFGTSGCVGCGRCVAWCPVGIDFTEEANAIAAGESAPLPLPEPRTYPSSDAHAERNGAAAASCDGQVPTGVHVLEVTQETHDVVTLRLAAPEGFTHQPGQFNMLSLPGIGDVPISISGSYEDSIEHTLRAVGKATTALANLSTGSSIGVRGPFGSAWPLELAVGRPVVVIAGGIGLAPLRGAIRELLARPDDVPAIRLLYGTRSPGDILFQRELLGWIQHSRMYAHVTVDRGAPSWTGNIGVVTKLMRRKEMPTDGLYLVCGPEIMMRFALVELFSMGVPAQNVYVSMERNMKCAAGLCGRCQYGPFFVCKDGPVFRYDTIADIFGKTGF